MRSTKKPYTPVIARAIHKAPLHIKSDLIVKIYRNKRARFSVFFLLFIILLGILAPLISPESPTEPIYTALLHAPSKEYLLGTDALGRDVLSRLLHGIRITIKAAFLAVGITFTVGTLIGLISAYVGGFVDNVLMRFMDVLLALPSIVLALSIVAVIGPSLNNAMIAVGAASIPGFSRLTRGVALSVKSSGYVEASRSIGSSHIWVLKRQFFPNISSVLLVYTTFFIGVAILDTAALSFLGLGAQPPTPEWGAMLNEGKNYIYQAWWLATFPGISITIVVFAVNFLGDALRDIIDPTNN